MISNRDKSTNIFVWLKPFSIENKEQRRCRRCRWKCRPRKYSPWIGKTIGYLYMYIVQYMYIFYFALERQHYGGAVRIARIVDQRLRSGVGKSGFWPTHISSGHNSPLKSTYLTQMSRYLPVQRMKSKGSLLPQIRMIFLKLFPGGYSLCFLRYVSDFWKKIAR